MFKDLSIDEDKEEADGAASDEAKAASAAGGSLLAYRRTSDEKTLANHPLASGCDDNWTWNLKDKSHEVRLRGPKNRIAHFHPNWSNGTAGVRGTKILNQGRYYWELNVSQRIFGTR